MNKHLFLSLLEIYRLMCGGDYTAAVDRLTALLNATRNYSLDYDPSWEKEVL